MDDSQLRRLEDEARDFAQTLSLTVRSAFGPSVPSFLARAAPESGRISIHQDPATGLLLNVAKIPRLRLKIQFACTWDHAAAYLAVETSGIVVASAASNSAEPLFRYEYMRDPQSSQACAHMQVHGHRDAITYLMSVSGEGSTRSKKRRHAASGQGRIPQVSDLHFPVGGPRFRPCLEDILSMLIDEFGVDQEPGAREALAEGRARWRRHQLAAAVRDSPETAVRVLRELGYNVDDHPDGPRQDRLDKLYAM